MSYPNKITCFHAGLRSALKPIVENGLHLTWSTKNREWFGHGVYFFPFSRDHADRWVQIGFALGWWIGGEPAIMKAEVELGNCFWTEDWEAKKELKLAVNSLMSLCETLNVPLPVNDRVIGGVPVERYLDCAIYNHMHHLRELRGLSSYDTLVGYFEDGRKVAPSSMIAEDGHYQVCVRNHRCYSNLELLDV